ncbi:MAG: hypothetical protein ACTSWL_08045 [Promethearchaeota archaeon]
MGKKNSELHSIFIFDANFFIALKEIKASSPYINLAKAKDKLHLDFYVSAQIFNELPFLIGTEFQNFSKGVEIEMIKDEELNGVKNGLKHKGVHLLAQDPDLSLVALGKKLKNSQNQVFIITDDFKLSQNIETLGYRIKCLPLPAFLQILGKNLSGTQRNYWKVIRKKVLRLNLDFMMKRSSIYAPQAKIAWLIENAVSVAGEGIQLNASTLEESDSKKAEKKTISRVDSQKIIQLCEEFIRNRPLSQESIHKIKHFEPTLIKIKKARKLLKEAKLALMESKYRTTLKILRNANEILNRHFQLIGADRDTSKAEYKLIERLLASEISKIIFLRSYVLIENNKFITALSTLDQTALFATLAQIPETVLTINYLKGILYIFNSMYNQAIEQFDFNLELAKSLHINRNLAETLRFKAIIGGSITRFLIDQPEEAIIQVQEMVSKLNKKSIPNLMNALIDSGDYFLAMGFPEISTNLYSEAIECAIDSNKKWKYKILLSKMKQAYMASALIGTETRPSTDISILIDKFHTIQNVTEFNDMMVQFAQFTNKFYEPYSNFSEKGRKLTLYKDLPKEFRTPWECVKIQENEKTGRTLLIGFKENIGLVAFDALLDRNFESVPENYEISLKTTAKVRIDPPDEVRESLFLIRAIVKITNEDRDLEITRKIPVFFKQMRV